MAKRGRPPGFKMSLEHRHKIKTANILNYLQKHFVGERDMSATQVQVGLGLLKKVMPDLQATTLSGDPDNPVAIQTIERKIVRANARDSDR